MSQISLNTNLASLRTARRLGESTSVLRKTFERLASGLRINRASDDAAGLAIASSLGVDGRVYTQAVRNLNDGIGLLSVADGALEQLSNIVVRLRELSTQSANGTLGRTQRLALNQEAQQLSKEYTRIVRSTKFNGQLLFDSQFGNLNLQAGYGSLGRIVSGLGGGVGDGTFQQSQAISTTDTDPWELTTADFNSDGHDDIAYVNASGNGFSVRLGRGDGTFGAEINTTGTFSPQDLEVGDFNGDGITDIAAANASGIGNIDIYLGSGNGQFTKTFTSSNLGIVPLTIRVADVDNNGTQDLVIGSDSVSAYVFKGNGNGTFQNHITLWTGSLNTYDTVVGDFDHDGFNDIAAVSVADGNIYLFRGTSSGTFQAPSTIASGGSLPYAIETADLNGDGFLDLITSDFQAVGKVNVLINNGNGTFKSPVWYTVGNGAFTLELGDFNGDGIKDIAVGNYNEGASSAVSILLGNADGTFQPHTTFSGAEAAWGLTSGDYNEDGVIDLVVGNDGTASVHLLLGTATTGAGPLLPFDLSTQNGARQAIPRLDKALKRIALQRGSIGAFLSRIEAGSSNLRQASESVETARSQIVDADVAGEAAQLTRSQILQQISSAILGQANLTPQIALQLLQR